MLNTGDFMDAKVLLSENKLTRFEESVFGSMLQQMSRGNGYVKATQSNSVPTTYHLCPISNFLLVSFSRSYRL